MNSSEVRRHGLKVWAWRGLLLALVLFILYLALKPPVDKPDWFENADKVRHAGAFLVLYWVGEKAALWRVRGLVLSLLAFGLFIEVAQSFTPDRDASAADWLADAVGIAMGYGWQLCWQSLRARQPAT